MRGGAYLSARQALGMCVSLAGAFLLVKILGPTEWGHYAAALGFYTTVQLLSQLGIGVYLVRTEREPSVTLLHQAATLLALLGLAGALAGAATLPLLTGLSRLEGARLPTLAMYAALPLAAVSQVPTAILDRRLAYRRIAWIELSGQIAFFVVAITVASGRPNVWAPVSGWWAQQLVLLVGSSVAAGYLPHPAGDRDGWKDMLRYGLGYSLATWIYQLRRAANPLIVGRYLGAEAVAAVSLALQLVVQLSFVTTSVWRLSTAALARIQTERDRLRRAVEEGMRLQVSAAAPPLLLFAWLGPWLVPRLLGPEWQRVPEIFPYVAAGFLFNQIFAMQASTLFVLRRNLAVGATHAVQLALLCGVALATTPSLGIAGWGLGEVAAVGAFALMHRATAETIGAPRYGTTLLLAAAAGVALFTEGMGPMAVVPLVLVSILAQPWRDAWLAVQALRAARTGA